MTCLLFYSTLKDKIPNKIYKLYFISFILKSVMESELPLNFFLLSSLLIINTEILGITLIMKTDYKSQDTVMFCDLLFLQVILAKYMVVLSFILKQLCKVC